MSRAGQIALTVICSALLIGTFVYGVLRLY